jgi:hypothetical protein
MIQMTLLADVGFFEHEWDEFCANLKLRAVSLKGTNIEIDRHILSLMQNEK